MAALFTKFNPREFLDAERHSGNDVAASGGELTTLATLAALAACAPNTENQPVRDAVVTDPLSFTNSFEGVRAAKLLTC